MKIMITVPEEFIEECYRRADKKQSRVYDMVIQRLYKEFVELKINNVVTWDNFLNNAQDTSRFF